MLRYVVVLWNRLDRNAHLAADDAKTRLHQGSEMWHPLLEFPGGYVTCIHQRCGSDTAVTFASFPGLVLGEIFRRECIYSHDRSSQVSRFTDAEELAIQRSKGYGLTTGYWGSYLAVLQDPNGYGVRVLRAPMSNLSCFELRTGKLTLLFSHVDDVLAIKKSDLSVNWDSIVAQVACGDYLTNETGFNEIRAIECGECNEYRVDGVTTLEYWSPRKYLTQREKVPFKEASKLARRTTDYCVNSWASCHQKILHTLSGGLDSSIVLCSLSQNHGASSVTSVNYYSSGCGDERTFARSVSRATHTELVEFQRNATLDLSCFLNCARTVRPVLSFSAPDVELRNAALAKEIGASAIFDGELGDNVFGNSLQTGSLIQCFRLVGLGLPMASAILDYSVLTRQSVWKTILMCVRQIRDLRRNPHFSAFDDAVRVMGNDFSEVHTLASKDTLARHAEIRWRFTHPWLLELRARNPDAFSLLFGMIMITSTVYHAPFSQPDDPPRVSPLSSQPLVELSLKTPTYLHMHRGQDRAVARSAYSDLLPSNVLSRGTGKGGPDLWAKEVIEKNQKFLLEFFLDGQLVKNRLVERKKIEKMLAPRVEKSTVMVGEIFSKMYIESWLRQWLRVGTRQAA